MLVIAAMFSSCGGGEKDAAKIPEKTMKKESIEKDHTQTKDDEMEAMPMAVSLEVKAIGETMTDMAYEPKRLEVPAGSEVTVKLVNTAKAEAMIHNFVVIKFGAQQEVAEQGLAAGPDKEYIPKNENIIAATGLANPGETIEVKFKAPLEPGNYQFICTYPGHTAMKGILVVK